MHPARETGIPKSAATAAKVAADEMLGAASAFVRDLTPTGGYQLKLVGGVYRKKQGGVNPPLGGVEKSLRHSLRLFLAPIGLHPTTFLSSPDCL